MPIANEIKYEEVSKTFKLVDGVLYRYGRKYSRSKEYGWWKANFSENGYGYYTVDSNNKRYMAHRIFYCLYNQTDIPEGKQIHHIDINPKNNSKENLRMVTNRENNQNKRHHTKKENLIGACFIRGYWMASIRPDKKPAFIIKAFHTQQEAHKCYLKAVELIDQFQNPKQFRKLVKESLGLSVRDDKLRNISLDKTKKLYIVRFNQNNKIVYRNPCKTLDEAIADRDTMEALLTPVKIPS